MQDKPKTKKERKQSKLPDLEPAKDAKGGLAPPCLPPPCGPGKQSALGGSSNNQKRAVPWFDPAVRFFVYTPDTLEPTQKHGRHSQRSRGIPSNKLRALPPDPSTPLRSTHDDNGAKLFFHSRDLLVVFLRAMADRKSVV